MGDGVASAAFEFVSELGDRLQRGELDLPSFPEATIRIRRVVEDPDSGAAEIVRALSAEPVLAAKLMQIANSAAFNVTGAEITELRTAVTRLGTTMVRNATLSFAVQQVTVNAGSSELHDDIKATWTHSVGVAAIAYVIAKKLTRVNPDEALLAGLLHDIGKFYVMQRIQAYPVLCADTDARAQLVLEWHTGVGRAILESWNLPEPVCVAADEHDIWDREHLGPPDLVDIVMVANLHEHLDSPAHRSHHEAWHEIPAMRALGLDPDGSIALMRDSARAIRSLTVALAS